MNVKEFETLLNRIEDSVLELNDKKLLPDFEFQKCKRGIEDIRRHTYKARKTLEEWGKSG